MSKQFDLEQGIMQCWNLVDELKAVQQYAATHKMSNAELLELLDALAKLYQLKFENTFETFEGFLAEYYVERRAAKAAM